MQDAVCSSGPPPQTSRRIQLLGELRVTFAGQEAALSIPRKIGGLLGYLACFLHRAHSRDALIELFWPEVDLEAGRASLRNALPLLRRLLEPPGVTPGSLLLADRQTVRLDPERVTTDVSELERDRQAAALAASPGEQAALLGRAVLCYGGELLPGYYEPWVLTERKRLAEAYVGALGQLAAARAQQGDLEGGIEAARRAVQADPLEEEAHYDFIRHQAAAGQTAAARRHYLEMERLLKDEMEVTPSQSLSALLDEGERSRAWSLPAPLSPLSPERLPDLTPLPLSPIPVPLTPFFGRDGEIGQVRALLESGDTRLVTLTGLGGTGKTRLALEVARRLQQEGSEWAGVAFVSLVDLTDPRLIFQTIRGVLNLSPAGDTDPLDQIATSLSDQRFLLVLDNFEQLLEEGAGTVEQLLERVPDLVCLVTSRRPLALPAEAEYPVPPLPTPAAVAQPERLLEFASVRLFLSRAQAARPDFRVTAANAVAVAQLCLTLEGIPLALELAAARSPVLTPSQMLQHLADRFGFLVARHRDVADRHRTLRATLEWSYQSLPEPQQRLLSRLSVFRGGWTLEAAAAVCGETGVGRAESGATPNLQRPTPILDQLLNLRNASLVIAEEAGEAMRFRMLETVREYGEERLAHWGEAKAVRERHRDWFLGLAERTGRAFEAYGRPEQPAWLDRLDTEHDNLRAALACCFAEESGAEIGLRLAGALWRFWEIRGYLSEGRSFLAEALGRDETARPTRERAGALNAAGMLAGMQSDYEAARALFEEGLAIQRKLEDKKGVAWSVHQLGQLAYGHGDYGAARGFYEQSLALREPGDRAGIAWATHELGRVARAQGDVEAATALHAESLAIWRELGDKRGIAWSLEAFARLFVPVAPERVARLWGAAESLRQTLRSPLPPHEREEQDRAVADVREALGEEAFAGAWAAGREATLEEAIRCALETDDA